MNSDNGTDESLREYTLMLLRTAVAAILRGDDVAPALRFRIEGLLERLLRDDPAQAAAAEAEAAAILPANAALHVAMQGACVSVQLDLWQRRAPVIPTTKDPSTK